MKNQIIVLFIYLKCILENIIPKDHYTYKEHSFYVDIH